MSRVAEVLQSLREEQAHLRLELSRVERAIEALEEAMGPAAQVVRVAPEAPPAIPAAPVIESGAVQKPYAWMGITAAAAAYLASAGEPKTVREIADALRAGGFPTRSARFEASVRTTLNRSGSEEGIEQVPDGRQWRFVGHKNSGSD